MKSSTIALSIGSLFAAPILAHGLSLGYFATPLLQDGNPQVDGARFAIAVLSTGLVIVGFMMKIENH